jgi:hypothetical protein
MVASTSRWGITSTSRASASDTAAETESASTADAHAVYARVSVTPLPDGGGTITAAPSSDEPVGESSR